MYLSTQNITFSKGLARKLIPKYIGPYKIIQDFNNQSYKLELPMHLKKRGVHDVFHSSLLRIHMPNDDRLFPGRMDVQLGVSPEADDEWAVDVIRTHAGAGEDAVFEILWKSGDVTWMPYFQIKELQALEVYLELLGVDEISKLPEGKGNPPREDPQVFVGAIDFESSHKTQSPHNKLQIKTHDSQFSDINPLVVSTTTSFLTFPILNTPTTDILKSSDYLTSINHHTSQLDMPAFDGIKHPSFVRISKTEYALVDSQNQFRSIIHVGQIVKYLAFDQALREGKKITRSTERPYGYLSFANMFNRDAHPRDSRRLSTYVSTTPGHFYVIKSVNPVFLHEFRITSDQCGVDVPRPNLSEQQAAVFEEYATTMANQSAKRRKAIQERQDRRRDIFRKPFSRKRRYFDPIPEYDPVTSLNVEAGHDISFFYDVPTNNISSSDTTSPTTQPEAVVSETSNTSSDSNFYMGNSNSYTTPTTFAEPLAHLTLSSPEDMVPMEEDIEIITEPEAKEEGELSEMPE